MNKDKAKEELRDRKILAEIEYNQSEDAKKKDNLLKYIKALDIAIESLEREEIKDPEDLYLGIDIAIKILEKQRDKVEPYERKE